MFFLSQAVWCSGFHQPRQDFPLVLLGDVHVSLSLLSHFTTSVPGKVKAYVNPGWEGGFEFL